MKNNSTEAKLKICVFCSSSQLADHFTKDAAAFATLLAESQCSIIYGGTTCGLMKTVADAHKAAGGYLTGVIPEYMANRGIMHPALDEKIIVSDLSDRKEKMIDNADIIVALPGGMGTYDEFFCAFTLKQLKRHNKPLFLLNTCGFFQPLDQLIRHGIANNTIAADHLELYQVSDNPAQLVALILQSIK